METLAELTTESSSYEALIPPKILPQPPSSFAQTDSRSIATSRAASTGHGPDGQSRITKTPASRSYPLQMNSTNSVPDMQPPPAKRQRVHNYDRRPRLSICPSVSPDPELVQDRDRNDNTLKGKFEAIFEKYGRDFTDIADEINVMTGEVVVDQGHILGMQDEKDPGSPSRAKPAVYRHPTEQEPMGYMPRAARSITSGAEDVIASIEAMARRTVTGQTASLDEDEGDSHDFGGEVDVYPRGSVSSDSLLGIEGDDYQNAWGSQRSGSPDSLLGNEEPNSSIESFYDDQTILPPVSFDNSGSIEDRTISSSGSSFGEAPNSKFLPHGRPDSHSHPASNSLHPPSPPPFVKSNGKQKIVMKKINVSKAYAELQRQASSTPITGAVKSGAEAREPTAPRPLSQSKPSSKKAEPARQLKQVTSGSTGKKDTRSILKKLPVARPSSEPRTMDSDCESEDPLQ